MLRRSNGNYGSQRTIKASICKKLFQNMVMEAWQQSLFVFALWLVRLS